MELHSTPTCTRSSCLGNGFHNITDATHSPTLRSHAQGPIRFRDQVLGLGELQTPHALPSQSLGRVETQEVAAVPASLPVCRVLPEPS